jgi:hypothetical protein
MGNQQRRFHLTKRYRERVYDYKSGITSRDYPFGEYTQVGGNALHLNVKSKMKI